MPLPVPAAASPLRRGFDAVVTLSQDILLAHGLDGRGQATEAAARIAVQRMLGAALVRVQWRGPLPGSSAPPLVGVYPLGSTAPATGASWIALGDLCAALVREALEALAAR